MGVFRTDYEAILAHIVRSHSWTRVRNGTHTCTAIVDHSNTTVACANDAEVLDGPLGALDAHEFVFGRRMGLAEALGCA